MKTIGFLVAISAIVAILMAPDDQDNDLITAQRWQSIENVSGKISISQVAAGHEAMFGTAARTATSRM